MSTVKDKVNDAIKVATKNQDKARLECLRMAKGALLLKEKEGAGALTDEVAIAAMRAEVKKRQQSIEVFRQVNKLDAVAATEAEIAVFEEFLPRQLSAPDIEKKVRDYLSAHPEMNHAGKLTGAMKKELGDLADGKLLNEICRKVLE
jgi:uncharacterized protein YqeY